MNLKEFCKISYKEIKKNKKIYIKKVKKKINKK